MSVLFFYHPKCYRSPKNTPFATVIRLRDKTPLHATVPTILTNESGPVLGVAHGRLWQFVEYKGY